MIGYDAGVHAPGRCTNRTMCPEGDSSREPYQCTHTILLAHASVVHNYRKNYQKKQGGLIGITLNSDWAVPLTDSQAGKLFPLFFFRVSSSSYAVRSYRS
jgi:beta-glucosidase